MLQRRDRSSERAGFTLIEILVVISIIAVLAGLTVSGLQIAQRRGHIGAEQHTIALLRTAISSFSQELGDYPPTSLGYYRVRSVNDINDGNESLFLSLQTRRRNGPFTGDLDDARWVNLDADSLSPADQKAIAGQLDPVRSGTALLEYTDYWGNPYVYIHNRDYGRKLKYKGADGSVFEVEAAKSESTGTYAAPTSFQLWSLGPDGINQNGGGDDICSWKS